jgi:hypothetical protein
MMPQEVRWRAQNVGADIWRGGPVNWVSVH